MRGIVYCAGVGPGDPELMTLKTARLIRENRVIAVPGDRAEESLAWRIAAAAVPELAEKETVALPAPMTADRAAVDAAHREGVRRIEQYLDRGENVVYLTLGDPSVYCTFSYLRPLLEADGCTVETTPGVTSFCAAAARLGIPLTEWDEPLRVVPAAHRTGEPLDRRGTYVLMKSGGRMAKVKELLRRSGREAAAVENCGLEGERVYRNLEEIPDDAGYFTLIVAKEPRERA